MTSLLRIVSVIGLLVVVAVAGTPDTTRFWRAAFNFGHVPIFAAITFLFWLDLRSRRPTMPERHLRLAAVSAAMLVGLGIEIVQAFDPNRSASLEDLLRDGAGAAAAVLAICAWSRRRSRHPHTPWTWAAVAAVVLVAGADVVRTAAVGVAQQRALPTLASFDGTWWEADVVRVQDAELTEASSGEARIVLRPSAYPGIGLAEPAADWTSYRWLELAVEAPPGDHVPLTVRVHDRWHDNDYSDRFNRTFDLAPGSHRLRIPLEDIRHAPRGRAMDMRAIRGLMLFVAHPAHTITLGIGPIVLVR